MEMEMETIQGTVIELPSGSKVGVYNLTNGDKMIRMEKDPSGIDVDLMREQTVAVEHNKLITSLVLSAAAAEALRDLLAPNKNVSVTIQLSVVTIPRRSE